MLIKKEMVDGLIEIGVGIAVFVISLVIIKLHPDWKDEVMLGLIGILLPMIVAGRINLHTSIVELKESNVQLLNVLSTSMERSIPDIALITRYASADIPADEMPRVWSELSWLIQKNYRATNWMNPQKIYEESWGKSALAVQRVKAQCKCAEIKKVLIVDNAEELQSAGLKKELLEQHHAGIKLRYLEHARLNTVLPLHRFSDLQVDFGIFDDRYLLLWLVDKKRHLTGGKLIVDQEKIRAYSEYFDELLKTSTAYGAGS